MEDKNPGHDKLKGVNIGGWLVLEKWMTPSLFAGTSANDEYGFMQTPGAEEKLDRHRKTFMKEDDFRWIAGNGLNAIRVPVGYWLLDGDDPYISGIEYLDFAMEMAVKYDLKVLIDLHGAKGSQNGSDHSGHIGKAGWFNDKGIREETIETLVRLAKRYRDSPALWGIELLNEPKVTLLSLLTLKRFYRDAYRRLVREVRPGTHIVFSDGFMPRALSGSLEGVEAFPALMDVHWYQFGKTEIREYFSKLERRPEELHRFGRHQPVIIGEWSGMLSHLTLAGLSDGEKKALEKEHIDRQLAAYAPASGWFYWTYKTEEPGIWNLRSLVERGVFPIG